MSPQKKKKLGQLLCERSYLDESGLKLALEEQKVEHRRLGQILLELGYITQAQLNEALAFQVGIEKIDLADVSIIPEIISIVPAELVSKHNILPLWHDNDRLSVAMVAPCQPQANEDY